MKPGVTWFVLFETHPPDKPRLKDRPIVGKIPLVLMGLGLAISLLGVALIPEFSPISASYTTSMPVCGTGLFLVFVGLILVFVFYLRRQKKK